MSSGPGSRLQPAHDPVRHRQDEGVSGGSGDAHGSDVPHRQGLPELTRPAPHLATDNGGQTQRGEFNSRPGSQWRDGGNVCLGGMESTTPCSATMHECESIQSSTQDSSVYKLLF